MDNFLLTQVVDPSPDFYSRSMSVPEFCQKLKDILTKELHLNKDKNNFQTLSVRLTAILKLLNEIKELIKRDISLIHQVRVPNNYVESLDCEIKLLTKPTVNQDQEISNPNSEKEVQDVRQTRDLMNFTTRECNTEDKLIELFDNCYNCCAERDTTLGGAKASALGAVPSESFSCFNENALSEIIDLLGSNERESGYLSKNVNVGVLIDFDDERCDDQLGDLMSFIDKNIVLDLTTFEAREKEIKSDYNEFENVLNDSTDLMLFEDINNSRIKDSSFSSNDEGDEVFSMFDEACDTRSQDSLTQLSKVLKQRIAWLRWQSTNEFLFQKFGKEPGFTDEQHVTPSDVVRSSLVRKRSEEKNHNFFVINAI